MAYVARLLSRLHCDHPLSILEVGYSPYALILKQLYPESHFACLDPTSTFAEKLQSYGIAHYTVNLLRDILPVDDNSLDVILFDEVLEHLLTDPMPILLDFYRATKPGGYLLIQTPNVASLLNRIRFAIGINVQAGIHQMLTPQGNEHVREYSMREVVQLVRATPWQLVKKEYPTFYDNVESAVVYRGASLPMRTLLFTYFTITCCIPPLRRGMALLLRK
jgi:SAM-dependent methyltransferase